MFDLEKDNNITLNNLNIKNNIDNISLYYSYINTIYDVLFSNKIFLQELEYLRYCLYGLENNKKNTNITLQNLEQQILIDFLLFDFKQNNKEFPLLEDIIDTIEDKIDPSHVPYLRKWVLENVYSIFKVNKISIKNQEIEIIDILTNKIYYTSILVLSKFVLKENNYYFGRVLPGKRLFDFYIHHDITFNNPQNIENELANFLNVIKNILNNTYSKKLNPILVHFVFVMKKDIPIFLRYQNITFPEIQGLQTNEPKVKAILTMLYQAISYETLSDNFNTILEKAMLSLDKPLSIFGNKSALELLNKENKK